jgi:hypothetical protein
MKTRVIHTRLLVGVHGLAVKPGLVLIQASRRDDQALLAHELTHCTQMHRDGVLRFWFRYFTSRKHRQQYEVEAYRVSAKVRPQLFDEYAKTLATRYRLRLSLDEARRLLTA